MGVSGAYGWEDLYPFVVCVSVYTYAFTAFMAAYVLRIPWELAGFIAMISIMVDNYTENLVSFLGACDVYQQECAPEKGQHVFGCSCRDAADANAAAQHA